MLKKVTFQVLNENEALDKAAELLKLSTDKITLSKAKRVLVEGETYLEFEAQSSINVPLEVKNYLQNILYQLNLNAQIEFRVINDEEINLRVDASNNNIIIGKEGKNLSSLQTLLRQFASKLVSKEDSIKITLDVANYQQNRIKHLEKLAVNLAREVVDTKQSVKLDPMNSYERRIVHEKLSKWKNISTESEGTGENRAVVISYVDKK